jgi:hypothetical protein
MQYMPTLPYSPLGYLITNIEIISQLAQQTWTNGYAVHASPEVVRR